MARRNHNRHQSHCRSERGHPLKSRRRTMTYEENLAKDPVQVSLNLIKIRRYVLELDGPVYCSPNAIRISQIQPRRTVRQRIIIRINGAKTSLQHAGRTGGEYLHQCGTSLVEGISHLASRISNVKLPRCTPKCCHRDINNPNKPKPSAENKKEKSRFLASLLCPKPKLPFKVSCGCFCKFTRNNL